MGNCIKRSASAAAAPAPFIPPPPPEPAVPAVPLTFADLPSRSSVLVTAFLSPNSRNEFRLTNRQAAQDGAASTRDIIVRNRIDLHRALAIYSPGGLHGITLNGASFTDDDLLLLPATLQRLKMVQCTGVSEHGIANLGALRALQELDLSQQRNLNDESLQALQHLPLQRLDLRECKQITDAGLANLPPTLTDLNLRSCQLISNLGLAHLGPHPLSKLTLDHCPLITDDGIAALPRTLQNLSMILCDRVHLRTEEPMAGMLLKTLNLNNRYFLNDDNLRFLPHSVTQLGLNGWRGMTATGIAHLMPMRLTDLDLGDCIQLSNVAITSLRLHQPEIKQLNLSNCSLIDDAGIAALANLPIEKLSLNHCHHLSDVGLGYLADLPLKKLNLTGCFRTTPEGRANFAALPQFEHTQFEF